MPTAPRPDHETLLCWMGAFFDGELREDEQAALFEAMAEDPSLEAEFVAMERTLSATAELSGLANLVMAQVAPAFSDDLTPLLSAYIDDEADEAQAERCRELANGAGPAALSFLHASEAAASSLASLPHAPAVAVALLPLPAAVETAVAREERGAELLSGLLDDALSASERLELSALVENGAYLPSGLVHLGEAVALTLASAKDHPAAERAGAAAMQAIEAAHHQQAAAAQGPSSRHAAPPMLERMRDGLARLFAPVAAAACALGLFVALERQAPEGQAGDSWPESLLASADDDAGAGTPDGALELLGDNSDTEVQALESGAQMAAVYSTEAHAITVIWVPEIVDDDSGKESGT